MQIVTDHKWKPFRFTYEVPSKVLKDYPPDENDGFLKYRGTWYHVSDFLRVEADSPLAVVFDGIHTVHAFCAVGIKVSDDGEYYKIGRVLC